MIYIISCYDESCYKEVQLYLLMDKWSQIFLDAFLKYFFFIDIHSFWWFELVVKNSCWLANDLAQKGA